MSSPAEIPAGVQQFNRVVLPGEELATTQLVQQVPQMLGYADAISRTMEAAGVQMESHGDDLSQSVLQQMGPVIAFVKFMHDTREKQKGLMYEVGNMRAEAVRLTQELGKIDGPVAQLHGTLRDLTHMLTEAERQKYTVFSAAEAKRSQLEAARAHRDRVMSEHPNDEQGIAYYHMDQEARPALERENHLAQTQLHELGVQIITLQIEIEKRTVEAARHTATFTDLAGKVQVLSQRFQECAGQYNGLQEAQDNASLDSFRTHYRTVEAGLPTVADVADMAHMLVELCDRTEPSPRAVANGRHAHGVKRNAAPMPPAAPLRLAQSPVAARSQPHKFGEPERLVTGWTKRV